MKRAILSLAFFIFSILSGHSQVLYGAKGGVNAAGVDFNSGGVYEYRKALYGGAFAKIDLNQRFFLQPELLYNVKGSKYSYIVPNPSSPSGPGFLERGTLSFNYVSLPLLVGYRPVGGLSVVLGPELGYMLSMESTSEATSGYRQVLGESNKLDIGLDLGLSYALSPAIAVEARFNYGFNTLNEHDEIPNEEEPAKPYILDRPGGNRVLQFGFTYTYGR